MASATEPVTSHLLQPATPDQWLAIKPIFRHLYIDENRTLEEVRRVLAQKYRFRATIKQYKRHITAWGIRKNYTAEEKEKLAKQKPSPDASSRNAKIQIRGKPVKWDRIHRHERTQARQKRQHVDPAARLAVSAASNRARLSTLNVLPLQLTDKRATIFMAAKNFYAWTASEDYSKMSSNEVMLADKLTCFALAVFTANLPMSLGKAQSWRIIHEVCGQLLTCAINSIAHLLWYRINSLLLFFKDEYDGLPQRLVDYIWQLCCRRLGHHNPLIQLLTAMATPESTLEFQRPMNKLFFQTVWLPNHKNRNRIADDNLLRNYLSFAVKYGDADDAKDFLRDVKAVPDHNPAVRRILYETELDMFYATGAEELCLEGYEELLEECLAAEDHRSAILCYQRLAICYLSLDNHAAFVYYISLSFSYQYNMFGSSNAATFQTFTSLIDALEDYEQWEALDTLMEEYPDMFEYLDMSLPTEEELDRMDDMARTTVGFVEENIEDSMMEEGADATTDEPMDDWDDFHEEGGGIHVESGDLTTT